MVLLHVEVMMNSPKSFKRASRYGLRMWVGAVAQVAKMLKADAETRILIKESCRPITSVY